jgi:hypothetical protein
VPDGDRPGAGAEHALVGAGWAAQPGDGGGAARRPADRRRAVRGAGRAVPGREDRAGTGEFGSCRRRGPDRRPGGSVLGGEAACGRENDLAGRPGRFALRCHYLAVVSSGQRCRAGAMIKKCDKSSLTFTLMLL